jgi:hypothetical protein
MCVLRHEGGRAKLLVVQELQRLSEVRTAPERPGEAGAGVGERPAAEEAAAHFSGAHLPSLDRYEAVCKQVASAEVVILVPR